MCELVFDDSYKHRLIRLYTAFAPSIRSERQWGGGVLPGNVGVRGVSTVRTDARQQFSPTSANEPMGRYWILEVYAL